MQDTRNKITNLISQVKPFDLEEQKHIKDALDWITSGVEIFRIEKPATPLKHLVSYSVLVDLKEKKILLFDHKKALKKLPSGGHIDKDEMPSEAAKREMFEELGIEPKVAFAGSEIPFFVTMIETVGITAGHIDVDLWYVFEGNSNLKINDEAEEFKREFDGYYWLGFEEIIAMPIRELDTNMHRFVNKLNTFIIEASIETSKN
jgi:ADP-ribose pyrophosphatase YjhB (NUDIX family)